ncbi:MAG: hypothetical protein ACK40O_06805 [Allosphingosinicella sp.]
MKIKLVFAAAGGLMLLGAAPPQAAPVAPPVSKSGYPPCSRTVTDNCIQLYERGVRTEANLARNARGGPEAAAPVRLASRSTHKPRRAVRRAGERG